jgi:hypothetical protein
MNQKSLSRNLFNFITMQLFIQKYGFLLFKTTDVFKDKDPLKWINDLRSKYPYASVTYKSDQLKDIWIICKARMLPIGFIKHHYVNKELTNDKPVTLYLDDMHLLTEYQKERYGYKVLQYLIRKKCTIQFRIAKNNEHMLHLSNECGFQEISSTDNTIFMERTVYLKTNPRNDEISVFGHYI